MSATAQQADDLDPVVEALEREGIKYERVGGGTIEVETPSLCAFVDRAGLWIDGDGIDLHPGETIAERLIAELRSARSIAPTGQPAPAASGQKGVSRIRVRRRTNSPVVDVAAPTEPPGPLWREVCDALREVWPRPREGVRLVVSEHAGTITLFGSLASTRPKSMTLHRDGRIVVPGKGSDRVAQVVADSPHRIVDRRAVEAVVERVVDIAVDEGLIQRRDVPTMWWPERWWEEAERSWEEAAEMGASSSPTGRLSPAAAARQPTSCSTGDAATRYRTFLGDLPERARQFLDLVRTRTRVSVDEVVEHFELGSPKTIGGLTGAVGRWAGIRSVTVPYAVTSIEGTRWWVWQGCPLDGELLDEDLGVAEPPAPPADEAPARWTLPATVSHGRDPHDTRTIDLEDAIAEAGPAWRKRLAEVAPARGIDEQTRRRHGRARKRRDAQRWVPPATAPERGGWSAGAGIDANGTVRGSWGSADGRERHATPVRLLVALWAIGLGVRAIAEVVGIPKSCIGDRLKEAEGERPFCELVEVEQLVDEYDLRAWVRWQ